jgi:hypothetical protein
MKTLIPTKAIYKNSAASKLFEKKFNPKLTILTK